MQQRIRLTVMQHALCMLPGWGPCLAPVAGSLWQISAADKFAIQMGFLGPGWSLLAGDRLVQVDSM
jgi:hypothetical protein